MIEEEKKGEARRTDKRLDAQIISPYVIIVLNTNAMTLKSWKLPY